MLLARVLEKHGEWLFKRRGYIPLAFLPVIFLAIWESTHKYHSPANNRVWEFLTFSISLFGLFLRCYTVGYTPSGTSGRNTKRHKAQTLNTKGMYSITRNPLYLGNFFAMLGVALFTGVWWAILIFVLGFWIYCERIIASEERFLLERFGKEYEEYVRRTPVFIPHLGLWKSPDISFSWKKVIRKEHSSFFTVILTFASLKFIKDYLSKGEIAIDGLWAAIFIFSSFICAILYVLKKRGKFF